MKIAILADSVGSLTRIANALEQVDGIDVSSVLWLGPRRLPLRRITSMVARNGVLLMRLMMRRRLILALGPLDRAPTTDRLRRSSFDVGLHAASTIYRTPTLSAFRLGVLNAHIGLLPEYRGRSVMEWAILNGHKPGISVFFMDEGIDSGPRIVVRELVHLDDAKDSASAKRQLFNLDGVYYAKAVQKLQRPNYQPSIAEEPGTRYYVMSELLTRVVDDLIASGALRLA